VPPAGEPFAEQEAALKASAVARAAEPSNEEPDTTEDRSAELRDSEAQDETLLRAHTTAPEDSDAVRGAHRPAVPEPDEALEPHPSADYLAVGGALAGPKVSSRPQLLRFSAAMHRRSARHSPVLRPEHLRH